MRHCNTISDIAAQLLQYVSAFDNLFSKGWNLSSLYNAFWLNFRLIYSMTDTVDVSPMIMIVHSMMEQTVERLWIQRT